MSKSVSDFTTEPEIHVNRDGLSLTFKPGKMLFSEVPAYNRCVQDAVDLFLALNYMIEKDGYCGTIEVDIKSFKKMCRHSGDKEYNRFLCLLEKLFIHKGFIPEFYNKKNADGTPNPDMLFIILEKPE